MVKTLLGVSCTIVLAGAVEAGSGRDGDEFNRFLAETSNAEADHWNLLASAEFRFETPTNHAAVRRDDLYYEGFVIVPRESRKSAQLVRWIEDRNGTRAIWLHLGIGLPSAMLADDVFAVVSPKADALVVKAKPWSFCLDSMHLNPVVFPANNDNDPGSIDLTGYLRSVMGGDIARTQWDQSTRSFTIVKSTGTTAELRFRTPSDQQRFGTALSAFVLHDQQGLPLVLRSWILGRSARLRPVATKPHDLLGSVGLDIKQVGELPLNDVELASGKVHVVWGMGSGDFDNDESTLARQLSHKLFPFDPNDDRQLRRSYFQARRQELLMAAVAYYRQVLLPILSEGRVPDDLAKFLGALHKELDGTLAVIESELIEGEEFAVVDDPTVLWRGFELAADPQVAKMVFNDLFLSILSARTIDRDTKIALCILMGEFGPPPWIETKRDGLLMLSTPFAVANLRADGPLLEAILHSAWQWAPTTADVDACESVLKSSDSSLIARNAAIGSLVRWGTMSNIPIEMLEVWFDRQHRHPAGRRRSSWKALTRTADGRHFLMSRIAQLDPTFQSQSEIAEVLSIRAESTMKMERFDFMPPDECEEVLQVCAPLWSQ